MNYFFGGAAASGIIAELQPLAHHLSWWLAGAGFFFQAGQAIFSIPGLNPVAQHERHHTCPGISTCPHRALTKRVLSQVSHRKQSAIPAFEPPSACLSLGSKKTSVLGEDAFHKLLATQHQPIAEVAHSQPD